MSDLIVSALFTKTGGLPATGLTLAQIALYLTAINKATGAQTVIWNGTQNPTLELTAIGQYIARYAAADMATYDYCAMAYYSGLTVLDSIYVYGSVGSVGADLIQIEGANLTGTPADVAATFSTFFNVNLSTLTTTILTTLANRFSGITSLANWLRGLARSDVMDAVAKAELNAGGGTWNEATDSEQALSDRLPAALVGGRMDSNIGAMDAGGAADFFTVNSGQTGAGAVAGSVVHEVAHAVVAIGTIFPAGAIAFTYTLTSDVLPNPPIQGADIWFSTDLAGTNIIWKGVTDVFGVARDVNNQLPFLDVGWYWVWRQKAGWTFVNPDHEQVS